MTNKEIAKDTLQILQNQYYINQEGTKISIAENMANTNKNTKFYFELRVYEMACASHKELQSDTIIEVWNCSSLQAIKKLGEVEDQEKIMCLNFASAKNPGGGFINGAQAQEESLARSSTLYQSQLQAEMFYDIHRSMKTCIYSDNMIYSPNVAFFKDDKGNLLDKPNFCNVITSAAVNAGVVKRAEPEMAPYIREKMANRIDKMLALAHHHNNEVLILGAWGCGVFRNDYEEIAELFSHYLRGKYKNRFKRVVFAILTKNQQVIELFEKI